MLSIKKLSRRFGNFTAVNNVSFTVEKGNIAGLLGHNGAGKTTVMKMITGYLEPNQGKVELNGRDIKSNPKIIHHVLGYLPESLPLYPEMKIYDYLDFTACMRGISKSQRPMAVKQTLIDTDLLDWAQTDIRTLSRGYKQRVGVAQAILGQPEVIILDEPTSGLDPEQTQHMRELIKKLGRKATVILSTHIMQEVEAICDHVLILRNGELAIDDTLDNLQTHQTILLVTDLSEANLKETLRGFDNIKSINVEPDKNGKTTYRLLMEDTSNLDKAIHEITRQLIESDKKIFQISPEKRDLETIFRQVTEGLEVSHAA